VADDQGAAGGEPVAQLCGDGPGVVVVVEVVQHRHQQHRDRLLEVQQGRHGGVVEDAGGMAQVGLDGGGSLVTLQYVVGDSDRDGVEVDADDPRVGGGVLDGLVGVAAGGDAAAEVEELADAGLGAAADRAVQEATLGDDAPRESGCGGGELAG